MGSDGVFSAEMPDELPQAIVPLDADTAERLLSARLDPDDAPPGYAEVARLLQAAAAPADPVELTGQTAAMDMFRTTHPHPAGSAGRPGGSRDGGEASRAGTRGRPTRSRGGASGAPARVVALALAGALAATAVGVWTAGGAPFSRELGSPSGGPGAAGPGSGTPGLGRSGPGGSGAGTGTGVGAAGSLRPAWPGLGSAPSTTLLPGGRPSVPASTTRHTGGETSPGRSRHGSKRPAHPGKQPKPKPPKVKPLKAESSKAASSRPKPGND
jgi:hypothetical protein